MKVLIYLILCGALVAWNNVDGFHEARSFPENFESEDTDDDSRILPQQDARRQDPDTDEQLWNDGEQEEDAVALPGAGARSVIYTSLLPANYHKKLSQKKKVGHFIARVNTTINKHTNPYTGVSAVSIVRTYNVGKMPKKCRTTSQCGKGKYCAKHGWSWSHNYCANCTKIGGMCDVDAECCGKGTKNALCVRDKCKNGYTKGQAGTICKKQSDCHQGLCCARSFFGKPRCKALARRGHACAKTASSVSEHCPCVSGLVCKSSDWFDEDDMGDMTCTSKGKKTGGGSHWGHGGFWGGKFDEDDEDLLAKELY